MNLKKYEKYNHIKISITIKEVSSAPTLNPSPNE